MYYVTVCVPMFIWVVGLVPAVVRWRQAPRNSLFAIGGFVAMLIVGVIQLSRNAMLGVSPLDLGGNLYVLLLRVFSFGEIFFSVVGWVLILLAIFGGRKAVQHES
ncbi:MAG: hypothetical protein HND47_04815 [Chloroflexi bacterium]|nr:hypothetical protein [Chloroflexota bacterium]